MYGEVKKWLLTKASFMSSPQLELHSGLGNRSHFSQLEDSWQNWSLMKKHRKMFKNEYFHTVGCVSVQLINSLLVFFSCSLTDVVYIYEYCRMAVAFMLPRLQFSIIPLLKTLGNQHFNYTAYYFSCVMYIPIRFLGENLSSDKRTIF